METYYYVEELPLALEYGMSEEQFWNGDPDLFYAYQKAYTNRTHTQAYINALYNKVAIELAMGNAFKGKNDKYIEYPHERIFNPFEKTQNKANNEPLKQYTTKQIFHIKEIINSKKGENE